MNLTHWLAILWTLMKVDPVGGQAVIEGVMMRNQSDVSIAVRNPQGKILTRREPLALPKNRILKLPIIRGVVGLVQMLSVGIRALTWSANQQVDPKEQEELSGWQLFLTVGFSLGLTILLFVIAPFYLTLWITSTSTGLFFNIVDGVLRLLFFVGYLRAISLMNDVKRVFQYHGAEHKTVHCYEHKKKLTVANAKPFTTLHPRCGTSFLVIVIGISILVFSLVHDPRWWVNLSARIVLIPLIAGIGYELLKMSAKHQNNPFWKILIAPGLWTQKITTKEPDAKQLEVALVALKAVA